MNKFEVGVVNAHPIKFMGLQILTIWRTWMHARKTHQDPTKWYGVYASGAETVAAHCGIGAGAQTRAKLFAHATEIERLQKIESLARELVTWWYDPQLYGDDPDGGVEGIEELRDALDENAMAISADPLNDPHLVYVRSHNGIPPKNPDKP